MKNYIALILMCFAICLNGQLLQPTQKSRLNTSQLSYLEKSVKPNEEFSIVDVDTNFFKKDIHSIVLGIAGSGPYTYQSNREMQDKGDRKIWRGIRDDNELLKAHFVINGSMYSGEFYLDNDQYRIFPLGGTKHLVKKIKDEASTCGMLHGNHERHEGPPQARIENDIPDDFSRSLGECSIRLLIAYTDDVDATSPDVTSLIESYMVSFNDVNDNSLVDFDVEIARTVELNYAETTTQVTHPWVSSWTFPLDMIRFWDNDDGHMDNVHDLRALYDADMAILLLEDLTGVAGIAMDYETPANRAFCSMDWDAGGLTFVHEFGHLIAMRHDPFVDSSNGPPGYAYGHGFTWSGAGTNFRTVMAYSNACAGNGGCPRIAYWSNDDLQWGGRTMGNAGTSDNARVARQKEVAIQGFESQSNNKRVYINDTVDDGEIANIIAGNSIVNRTFITNQPTTIIYQNGSKGKYIAPNEITFIEGFHAKTGTTFEAILESCTGNN